MNLPATDPDELETAARAAEQAGMFDEALLHWAELRTKYPSRAVGYLGAIDTAESAGRRRLANQLILEGAARLPDKAALSERARRLPPEAAQKAKKQLSARLVRDLKSSRVEGDSLLDTALAPTLARRPGQQTLLTALAQVEALESRLPGRVDVRSACLRLLQGVRRLPQARELGLQWLAEHPDDVGFVLLVAEVLDNAGEVSAARDVVAALRARVGSNPEIDARLMSLTARLPGADIETVSSRALAEHPLSPPVLREWAVIAQRQGDWDEALQRWEAAERLAPKDRSIMKGLHACRLQLAIDQTVDTNDLARFFGRFSSLGGTMGGCEFGMIQSRYGSKALGLFRWSNIPAEDLIRGFETDFAGLGKPETTELTTNRNREGLEEYMVQDRAYNSSTHTLIFTRDAPLEKVRDQTMRRLGYLRDGLLDQLRKPDKIFVYKFLDSFHKSEHLIHRLWAALRRHGPVRLVCAVLTDDEVKRGTVLTLEDGLYVGFLGHMMGKNGVPEGGFDELGWRGVCAAILSEAAEQETQAGPETSAILSGRLIASLEGLS